MRSSTIAATFFCFLVSFLCLCSISTISHSDQDQSYLCLADQSAGFYYEKTYHKWTRTFFETDDKYLIQKPKKVDWTHDIPAISWVITKFGDEYEIATCNDFDNFGFLNCHGAISIFSFNRNSLRYQHIYPVGYVVSKEALENESGNDTPYIEIGTCSPL